MNVTRHWALAVLAIAALPCMARAQEQQSWSPRVRITPMAGFSPSVKQTGNATVVSTTSVDIHSYELKYSSSLPVGANLELHVWNRFSVIAGGAWSSRSDGEIRDFRTGSTHAAAGTDFMLGKAGVLVRLREVKPEMQMSLLDASLFFAPAMIRDVSKNPSLAPVSAITTAQHRGLNVGAEGELPLAHRHAALTIGFEDWMIFWKEKDNSPRVAAYLEQSPSTHVIAVQTSNSHLWVVRAGLTFRF